MNQKGYSVLGSTGFRQHVLRCIEYPIFRDMSVICTHFIPFLPEVQYKHVQTPSAMYKYTALSIASNS